MSSDLAIIDRVSKELAEARSIFEVSDVRAKAAALKDYLRRKGAGEAMVRDAGIIVLRADRRIGQLLEPGKEKRGRKIPGSARGALPTLPDGITKKESSQCQRIAKMSDADFEDEIAKPWPTRAAVLKRAKLATGKPSKNGHAGKTCTVADLAGLPEAHFGTIYADPPWDYGNQATRAATGNHYATMDLKAICALPVAQLAAKNAHCHLWTTNGFLRESFDVMEAWGFDYRSCFVWCKEKLGIGNYWRVSHEFMLFGIRGSAAFRDKTLKSWAVLPRGEHSAKPESVRQMVQRASPGPYLELFGRKPVEEWTVWGNQIDKKTLKLFS